MRASLETYRRPAALRQHHKHRWLTGLIVVALIASTSLFLAYADWRQKQDEVALKAAQTKQFATIDANIKAALAAKVEKARKAEAEAKAKAAADAAAKAKVAAASQAKTATAICDVTNPSSVTVIINKKHCFSPSNWAPDDLVSVNGYYVRSEAALHLTAMMNDAAAAGVGFSLSSTYRSYSDQLTTYNNWVAVNGSAASADTVSARPGYSEHQTGLAADLKAGGCVLECFGGTAQYQWLVAHAADYGYMQRYPEGLTSITGYSPEAWHWRYVGIAVAQDMKAKGIETLEQYFGVSGGDYAN